ncbi:MAG TPA: ATPase [Clostridium sp.]|mgnify:FL=1|jgi:V/A-type H+-transporting ATPase subunit K|nr:ATPase [Clostridium sp.]
MEFVLGFTIFMVLFMVGLGIYQIKKGLSGKNAKKILGINVVAVFGLLLFTTILIYSGYMPVFAEGTETASIQSVNGLGLIAAALSTGLAAIGAGIAVAVSSSAALGAISEDSSLLGKTLIFVGLSEGIAIYGLIVSILILGRL